MRHRFFKRIPSEATFNIVQIKTQNSRIVFWVARKWGGNGNGKSVGLVETNRNLACAEGTEIAGTRSRDG